MKPADKHILAMNRPATFNYSIIDTLEVGIELIGSEVKSCVSKNVTITEAYCVIKNRELYLINANIAKYNGSSYMNHEPLRDRRLLAHKQEIRRLASSTVEKGFTLIPLNFHISKSGKIKVDIAVCKGMTMKDKRDAIKERLEEIELRKYVK